MNRQDEYYTLVEAATVLGINDQPETIENWLASGSFAGSYQDTHGKWWFRKKSVISMAANMKQLKRANEKPAMLDDDGNYPEPPKL